MKWKWIVFGVLYITSIVLVRVFSDIRLIVSNIITGYFLFVVASYLIGPLISYILDKFEKTQKAAERIPEIWAALRLPLFFLIPHYFAAIIQ